MNPLETSSLRLDCGYRMADCLAHWLALAPAAAAGPRIYAVNWFRRGADGRFLWPGYGDNLRVLKWIVERLEGRAAAAEQLLGHSPGAADLGWRGCAVDAGRHAALFDLEGPAWQQELAAHADWLASLGDRVPAALTDTQRRWQAALQAGLVAR